MHEKQDQAAALLSASEAISVPLDPMIHHGDH